MKYRSRASTVGFTLIELLVVISIIGMLSSVSLATLSPVRGKARDAIRLQDMRTISQALEIYYGDYSHYPCGQFSATEFSQNYRSFAWSLNDWKNFNDISAGYCNNTPPLTPTSTGIIRVMPKDPINKGINFYVYEARNGDYTRGPQQYILYTVLESDPRGATDGGLCSLMYEQGNTVGTMYPSVISGLMPCNTPLSSPTPTPSGT